LKLLLVGFDGLDYELLSEHLEKNPDAFLNKLGGTLCLMKPSEPITIPGWHEVFTGWSYHGTPKHVPRMWRILEAHYRVGMLGLPYTHPAKSINGWWVAGYPANPEMNICFPKHLVEPLLKNYVVDVMDVAPKPTCFEEWVEASDSVTARHLSLLFDLMMKRPVEVLLCQFSFPDHLAHLVGWQEELEHHEELVSYTYRAVNHVVEWLCGLFSPENLVLCSDHGFPQTSNHKDTGVAYFWGNDIHQASVEMRNIDLLPTLLFMLGVPPVQMEGEVKYEIFKSQVLSGEEEEMIKEKLRRLGYLE